MIESDLWLCSVDNKRGGTWEEAHTACHEKANFYLATVTSMSARGAPSNINIEPAMRWAASKGFDYAITGQPVRDMTWAGNKGENGFGYIATSETSSDTSNWAALVDGNGNEKRNWPSANSPSQHTLVSLCQNAQAIPNACVYDFRWRVGSFSSCKIGNVITKISP